MLNRNILGAVIPALLITHLSAEVKLDEVVVTAKSNKQLMDTAGSTTIVTKEDIKQMGVTSLNEVLEETVGITQGINSSSTFGRKVISVRGLDSKNSLILIDGRKISGTDAQIGHSDFQYDWLPLSAIEKIEIVRGPMSSLYGANALGGVINIITKKPDETIESKINFKTGKPSHSRGGNENETSLISSGKVNDNFSYSFFGQWNNRQKTTLSEDNSATEIEGKEVKNFMANGWFTINDSSNIVVSVLQSNEIRQTNDFSEYYDIDKKHLSIEYNKNFDDFSLNTNWYTTQSDNHTEQFSYSHILKDTVFNTEAKIHGITGNYIVLGAEARKETYEKEYDTPNTGDFKDSFSYYSLYLQDEIEINTDFILTLGLRYDKHDNFGSEVSPKAYMVYKPNEKIRVKAGYGHGFNSPTVTQNSNAYTFRNFYAGYGFNGNENLKPESSDSYEIGVEYYGENNTLKATAFYNDIKDLIDTANTGTTMANPLCGMMPPGFCPFPNPIEIMEYSNVDKAITKGLEVEYLQKGLWKDINLSANYTYLSTEDKSNNQELILRPKHSFNTKLNYALPHEIDSTVRFNYIGEQYDANYEKLDAYSTVSFQLGKNFSKNIETKIGIENLTNRHLDEQYNYQIRGRFYYVSFNYTF